MRAMFPDEKGFSSANLRYMKRWYEFYYQRIVNLQQPVEDLKMPDTFMPSKEVLAREIEQQKEIFRLQNNEEEEE